MNPGSELTPLVYRNGAFQSILSPARFDNEIEELRPRRSLVRWMVIAASLAVTARFMYQAPSNPSHLFEDENSLVDAHLLPFLQSSDVVPIDYNPNAPTSNVTFGGFAQSILMQYYNKMFPMLTVLTPHVHPGEVYQARKALLMTRDLLDVFAPVYPNTTSVNSRIDPWHMFRSVLDEGYETVGHLLDLNHSGVIYHRHGRMAKKKRKAVLRWYTGFRKFTEVFSVSMFLQSPSAGHFLHQKESHLFWDGSDSKRPNGKDPVTPGLQILAKIQLKNSHEFLWSALAFDKIDEKAQEHYHDLRKLTRSIVDEYNILGKTMFPQANDGDIKVLERARKILGDLNDEWTAYSIYAKKDEFHHLQKNMTRQMNSKWQDFKVWVKEVNLDGVYARLEGSIR